MTETTWGCCALTALRLLSATTDTAIWVMAQEGAWSPDSTSARLLANFWKQHRYFPLFLFFFLLAHETFLLASLSSKLKLLPLLLKTLFGHRGREKQRFQLFTSSFFGERDLLFQDATEKLSVLADDADVSQVLGLDYVALLKGLGHEGAELEPSKTYQPCRGGWLRLCVQEVPWRTASCGGAVSATLSRRSVSSGLSVSSRTHWCAWGPFPWRIVLRRSRQAIHLLATGNRKRWTRFITFEPQSHLLSLLLPPPLLQRDEVDAVSLDATHTYIAGKCGLVPVVTENYGKTAEMAALSYSHTAKKKKKIIK